MPPLPMVESETKLCGVGRMSGCRCKLASGLHSLAARLVVAYSGATCAALIGSELLSSQFRVTQSQSGMVMRASYLRDCGCVAVSRDVFLQKPRVGPSESGGVGELSDVVSQMFTGSLGSIR
jgi:hypothetical protein